MTQTANNYGEVLFELGIKKDTVEESKRIFSLTEQLHRTLESPIISKNEKYSIIEKKEDFFLFLFITSFRYGNVYSYIICFAIFEISDVK